MARIYVEKDENGNAQIVLEGFDLSEEFLGGALHLEGIGNAPVFKECLIRKNTGILIWDEHNGAKLLGSVGGGAADLDAAQLEDRTGRNMRQMHDALNASGEPYDIVRGPVTLHGGDSLDMAIREGRVHVERVTPNKDNKR